VTTVFRNICFRCYLASDSFAAASNMGIPEPGPDAGTEELDVAGITGATVEYDCRRGSQMRLLAGTRRKGRNNAIQRSDRYHIQCSVRSPRKLHPSIVLFNVSIGRTNLISGHGDAQKCRALSRNPTTQSRSESQHSLYGAAKHSRQRRTICSDGLNLAHCSEGKPSRDMVEMKDAIRW
jgi:hypothetical protein